MVILRRQARTGWRLAGGSGEGPRQEKWMLKPRRAEDDSRGERRRAVNDYRREIILAAGAPGLRGSGASKAPACARLRRRPATPTVHSTSITPARRRFMATCSAGSLDRLQAAVFAAVDGRAAPVERLLSATLAFFDYYRDSPGDLDLGFYLFRGMKPLGLTRDLNADLNGRLRAVLGEVERALGDLRPPAPEPREARDARRSSATPSACSLLVHTGRMRLFRPSTAASSWPTISTAWPRGSAAAQAAPRA